MNLHQLQSNSERSPRVLVVDDQRFVRRLIGSWLCDEGYECLMAEDVQEAKALMVTKPVDVITCDITMPGQSGAEWLPSLFLEYPQIAVLMLTGCEDIRLAVSTLTQGAWGYLIKPVKKQELSFQVSRALERQRMLLAQRDHTRILEGKLRAQEHQLRDAHEETIARLIAASKLRDDETGEHVRRLGVLSSIVARQCGWSAREVETIRLAAPMHDIGKVGIPDSILLKPGKLTFDEREIMKKHTEIGAQILCGSRQPMLQMAEQIARWHHERWDGQGYPDGKQTTQIPLAARIVSVVDVYDALSHDRVYRPALPKETVLSIMSEGRGSQFDPNVLNTFFEVLPLIEHFLDRDEQHSKQVRCCGTDVAQSQGRSIGELSCKVGQTEPTEPMPVDRQELPRRFPYSTQVPRFSRVS